MVRSNKSRSEQHSSRRTFLKITGGAGAIGMTGLAGCTGSSGGGSGNGGNGSSGGSDPIKLGAINPLSGPSSQLGQSVQKVQKGWAKHVNNNGGIKINGEKRKIDLHVYDGKAKNNEVKTAMQKLATVDKVSGVISVFRSSGALAAAPIAKKNKIPVFTAGMTPKVNEPGSYVFRNLPSTAGEPLPNLHLISDKLDNIDTIGVIAEEGSWGDDTLSLMDWWFHKHGKSGDYKDLGRFPFSNTDFSSFITKLKSQYNKGNIQATYIQTWASAMTQFMKQADQAGLNDMMPIITATGLADFASLDEIKGGLKNARTESQADIMLLAEDNPKIKKSIPDDVWKRYQTYKNIGSLPSTPIALDAYSFAEAMIGAIKAAGTTDGEKVRNELVNNRDGFTTLVGKFKYTDSGQPPAPITNFTFSGYSNGAPKVGEVSWDGTIPPVVNIPPKVDVNF